MGRVNLILSDINHLLDFVFGKAGVFFVLLLKGAIVFPDGRGMGDLRRADVFRDMVYGKDFANNGINNTEIFSHAFS